jgi:uncharacterized protein (TIGR03067 family)
MRLSCICLLIAGSIGIAAEPDVAKKDLDACQGTWTVESMEYNGKELKDKYKITFTCKGDVMTVEGDGKVRKEYAKLKLKFDPTTTPKCLDMTVADGIQKDAVMEGVYEIKDDVLKVCVKVFGKDRPLEFKSPDGSSIVLLTLKRKK